jgi:hypothetical protein
MKKCFNEVQTVPTANIAVNKSRLKVYTKNVDMPTYYLQKGQEFQIELFNPTTDVVLAKISLNDKYISQGGLVLNPGQRVFLDRYLDIPKKFLFDTYEVSNTKEVQKAIENNGDVKVEFFRESKPRPRTPLITLGSSRSVFGGPNYDQGIIRYNTTNTDATSSTFTTTNLSANVSDSIITNNVLYSSKMGDLHGEATLDWLGNESNTKSVLKSKKIETGRIEEGSDSDQKFKTVNKDFEYFAFHTIEYKLLPVSQKINTLEDINVKRYCTNCGSKLGKGHKFCANCGTKA